MIVRIREEAEKELEQAFDHYEQQREGLGQEFLDEYVRGTHKLVEAPLRWPTDPVHSQVRRFRLDRFPYVLMYRVEETQCMIIAIAHSKRKPGYWLDRIEP